MTSLLDILTKEKESIEEIEEVRDRIVYHLYRIDDANSYPNIYKNIDVKREKEEVEQLKKREEQLEVDIKNTRNSLARYLLKLYER